MIQDRPERFIAIILRQADNLRCRLHALSILQGYDNPGRFIAIILLQG
jgi:hypothetical protein